MHLGVIKLARIPLRGATWLFRRRRTRWGFETASTDIWQKKGRVKRSTPCLSFYAMLPAGVGVCDHFLAEALNGLAVVLAAENSRAGYQDICTGSGDFGNGVFIYAAVNFD